MSFDSTSPGTPLQLLLPHTVLRLYLLLLLLLLLLLGPLGA